ncbi:MAG: hypothetical protein K0S82_1786 [Gaiellaceae bacterium]|jgi:hypothetical protein|nr:hypothetical protein [Gaiellaceae bacterium]
MDVLRYMKGKLREALEPDAASVVDRDDSTILQGMLAFGTRSQRREARRMMRRKGAGWTRAYRKGRTIRWPS